MVARRVLTKKEGPNKGRWFYGCAKDYKDSTKCSFFKWEDEWQKETMARDQLRSLRDGEPLIPGIGDITPLVPNSVETAVHLLMLRSPPPHLQLTLAGCPPLQGANVPLAFLTKMNDPSPLVTPHDLLSLLLIEVLRRRCPDFSVSKATPVLHCLNGLSVIMQRFDSGQQHLIRAVDQPLQRFLRPPTLTTVAPGKRKSPEEATVPTEIDPMTEAVIRIDLHDCQPDSKPILDDVDSLANLVAFELPCGPSPKHRGPHFLLVSRAALRQWIVQKYGEAMLSDPVAHVVCQDAITVGVPYRRSSVPDYVFVVETVSDFLERFPVSDVDFEDLNSFSLALPIDGDLWDLYASKCCPPDDPPPPAPKRSGPSAGRGRRTGDGGGRFR